MAAGERVPEHGEDVGIHEGLAAGEADFPRGQSFARDLIEEGSDLGARHVDEPVVLRARLDVAIAAFDVAEAAGVDPQRAQRLQGDEGAGLAGRRPVRIAEFALARLKRGLGHAWCPCKPLGPLVSRSRGSPQGARHHPFVRPILPSRPALRHASPLAIAGVAQW